MFSNGDADSLANSIKKTTLEDRADFPLNNAQEGHTLKVEAKLGGETQLEHVFIKNLAGKVTRLDVDQSTTVLELKQKIEAEMKIKTRSQQIFLKNIGLKDDHAKLRNFNIKNGDELNLIASKKSALQQWKEEHPDDAQQSWTQKKYAELIARELPFLQKDEKYCFGPSGRTNHSGQEIFDLIVLGQKGTPYEGGLFWIDVAIPDDFPFKAPLLKFQTRIFHPRTNYTGTRTYLMSRRYMNKHTHTHKQLHIPSKYVIHEREKGACKKAYAEILTYFRQYGSFWPSE